MVLRAEELAKLKGHRWQISCLEFSPDGSRLASGGWDKEIHIWDLSTLETSTILKDKHSCPVTTVSWFQPDGSLLAAGSADFTTTIWNAATGEHLLTLREHFGWVLDSDFSGNGSLLATASWDKTVRIWDPATGALLQTLNGHTKGVFSCHFHPVHTSAVLCTASDDETIRIWDARVGGKPLKVLVNGHDDAVTCCRWSPDASLLSSGSADTKITIWEPREGKPLFQLSGHEDTVKDLAFDPNSASAAVPVLASAGDCTSRLWDPREGHEEELLVLKFDQGLREVETVAISPDGSLLATGGRDNLVTLTTLGGPRPAMVGSHVVEPFHETAGIAKDENQLWRRYTHKVRKSAVHRGGMDSEGDSQESEEESSSSDDDGEEKAEGLSAIKKVQLKPVKVSQTKSKGDGRRVTGMQLKEAKKTLRSFAPVTAIEKRRKRSVLIALEDGHRLHISKEDLEYARAMKAKACAPSSEEPSSTAGNVYDDVVSSGEQKEVALPAREPESKEVSKSDEGLEAMDLPPPPPPLSASQDEEKEVTVPASGDDLTRKAEGAAETVDLPPPEMDSFDLLDQLEEAARKEAAEYEELEGECAEKGESAQAEIYEDIDDKGAVQMKKTDQPAAYVGDNLYDDANSDPLYSTVADAFQ
eukprot:m.311214 g.311214  ORF g.311214 m.311214 type:complete len:644 (+) comp62157_c0_seq1:51-1982(+)